MRDDKFKSDFSNFSKLLECEEYSKLVMKKIQVASLSIEPASQDITYTECDSVTGLVVGGVNANPFEFPHMAAIGKFHYRNLNVNT